MNAKQFNELLKKYNVGYLKLEKTYADEGDNTVYPYVLNNEGKPFEQYVTNHFYGIEINDSTLGEEWEGDITDETYEDYEIDDLQFYTPCWAYPEAYLSIGDKDIDDKCGIRLCNFTSCHNIPDEIEAYAEQALKAYLKPEEYQAWLLEMYLSEIKAFNEKHLNTLKEYGFKMKQNDLFKRGFGSTYESEITLEFETEKGNSKFFFWQNMFTGKFEFHVYDEKENEYGGHSYTSYNVNEVSEEFLRKYLDDLFKRTGELFWRNKTQEEINELYANFNNNK